MVCFEEHYVEFDQIVHDVVTGDPLDRYRVMHESGKEVAKFVLPPSINRTRWEIQYAAKDALKAFQRRRRIPAKSVVSLKALQ